MSGKSIGQEKFGEPELETKFIPQQKKMAVTNLLPNQAAACAERWRCKLVSESKGKKNSTHFQARIEYWFMSWFQQVLKKATGQYKYYITRQWPESDRPHCFKENPKLWNALPVHWTWNWVKQNSICSLAVTATRLFFFWKFSSCEKNKWMTVCSTLHWVDVVYLWNWP